MSKNDLRTKIDTIFADVSSIKPMVTDLLENFKAMDARQRFLETSVGKHDVQIDFATKDINALGVDLKELKIRQIMRTAAQPGESIKWVSFLEFLVILPKYWKAIALSVGSLLSLLMMAYEFLKHRI